MSYRAKFDVCSEIHTKHINILWGKGTIFRRELRRETISFVMSVRPSVRMELGSHWTDFHEI
jgi:hypothetical protein